MKKFTCSWTSQYRLKAMGSDGRTFIRNDYSTNNVLSSMVCKFGINNNILSIHSGNCSVQDIFFLIRIFSLLGFQVIIFQSLYFWRSEELCQGSLLHIWSWINERIYCKESQVRLVRTITYEKGWSIKPLKVWEPVGKKIYKEK